MVSVPALIAIECRVTATIIHMVAQTSTWTSWAHWAFLGSMETHYWASATISRWATVSGSRSALWCSKDLISILRYTGSSSQKFALPSNISSLFFFHYYYLFPIHYFSLYFFVFILSNLLVCSPDHTKTLHGMCACTQILHHKCITFETSMFNHNNASLEKWNVIKGDWNFLSRITEKPNTYSLLKSTPRVHSIYYVNEKYLHKEYFWRERQCSSFIKIFQLCPSDSWFNHLSYSTS